MFKSQRLILILCCLLFAGLFTQAQSDTFPPRHASEWMTTPLRGAVVELSWRGGGEEYEPGAGFVPSPELFEEMRDLGANVVVVYVQQTWTLEAPYEPIPEEIALLEETLNNIGDTLPIVVGIRNGPGRNAMMPNFEDDLLNNNIYESEDVRQAYLAMLRDTVNRFADNPNIIAWEPMIEPTPHFFFGTEFLYVDESEKQFPPMPQALNWWNNFAGQMITAIRDVLPEMTIMIEPIFVGSVDGFNGWSAFADDNIVYSLHHYDPFEYTHQFSEPYIEYPYYSDIEVAQVDAAWVDSYLAPVDAFQQAYNVPIFVGEWGLIRWVPGAEQFLRDNLNSFERRGWSHALYAWYDGVWDGSGFELQFGAERENIEEVDYDNPLLVPVLESWALNGN
ncbi:MAG: glycoside hydrolase family 5 protein [Aggregatilineales bacterium]